MRKILPGLLLLLFVQTAFAQPSVKGKVTDTLGRKDLSNAVVTLLQKKDSSLYKFSRTDKNGQFSFSNVLPGKYVLLITYPKFADFSDPVEIKDQSQNDLGMIPLTLKSKLLDAVVIRSAGAIRIKGDTTEFVADSFHVKEGATVEDLLKKLPGFQVNSKGEITAQGQRVQKVLVDGEEFFGDDPTMATKNLSAKAVDKVQVFDNKTEQQNMTGISTGSEGKTVNIKLKEDQKKGSFGKIEAGSNFDNVTDAKALYNRFIGKKKLSLYGTKSNTSTGSLNWEDKRKLGFEDDFQYDELSGYYFSFGTSDNDFSDWSLRGIPNAYTAGALYITKWNADKQSINGSYRFNRLGTKNVGSKFEQRVVPGNVFYTNTTTTSSGLNQQNAANFRYEWKIDSLASLKFTTAEIFKNTQSFNSTSSKTTNENFSNSTVNNRTNENDTKRWQSDNQLQYRQAFNKKNRLLLATFRYGVTTDDQAGFIYSNVDYLTGSTLDSSRMQDQQKLNTGNSHTLGGKVTFSEPLSTKWALITEYSYNQNKSTSHKNTFDKSTNGKYENLNPVYSNNFDLDAYSNSGSVIARYFFKKFRMAVGSGASSVKLNLHDLDHNKKTSYDFVNLTPQASLNYAIKPQSGLGFNYRGTTRQPTINQLQPIRDNNDPLNEYIGNPDLKVGFNHNLSLFYNSYKVLSGRGIWANASYNKTQHAITQSNTVDLSGKRTYKPVNVEGNSNWNIWTEWNKGEGEKKFNHTARFNANGGRNITIVNGQENRNDYYTLEVEYGIRYESPDKYKIDLSPKINYNNSTSSLNTTLKNNYYGYGGEVEAYLMLPGKIELNTNIDLELRQRIEAFAGNPNIILWNANISRKFFKDKSGKLMFLANDILDNNKGFTRIINSDRLYEERYQRISRYFMLKFEWTFNKMGGQK
jgi:hypothetical protein